MKKNQRRHARVKPRAMSSRVRVGGALHLGLAVENLSLGGAFVRCAQVPPLRSHATLEVLSSPAHAADWDRPKAQRLLWDATLEPLSAAVAELRASIVPTMADRARSAGAKTLAKTVRAKVVRAKTSRARTVRAEDGR